MVLVRQVVNSVWSIGEWSAVLHIRDFPLKNFIANLLNSTVLFSTSIFKFVTLVCILYGSITIPVLMEFIAVSAKVTDLIYLPVLYIFDFV